MTQKEMQVVTSTYFLFYDTGELLSELPHRSKEVEALRIQIAELELWCLDLMTEYISPDPAASWAARIVPVPYAAALSCGLHATKPGQPIDSAARLIGFCGMEARKYLPASEIKRILLEITGGRKVGLVTEEEITQVSERLRLKRTLPPGPAPFDSVYLWATRHRHSEFLRTICLRLAVWISETENPYRSVYLEGLELEGKKPNPVSMEQAEQRSRSSAVRRFLSDYYRRLAPNDPA